ncbi:hypothetical protein MRB53_037354 [Persea americana]|nr:hypothetical protein MRB53_037354 [Persea americana]
MSSAGSIALLFLLKETYPPLVLVKKASDLRRRTKNWRHSRQAGGNRVSTSPSCTACCTLLLTAYAIVFQEIHGFNKGVGSLPYFGLIIGVGIGFSVIVYQNKDYARKLAANNDIPVPEWRMPIVIVGGIVFAIGCFGFGWTGYKKDISWVGPAVFGIPLGFGIFTVFLQLLNYQVDAYLMFAASAVAANTILRSIFGAAFPLFAAYMFEVRPHTLVASTLLMVYRASASSGAAPSSAASRPSWSPCPSTSTTVAPACGIKSKLAPALDVKLAQKRKQDEEAANGHSSESGSGDGEKGAPAAVNGEKEKTKDS